MDETQGLVHRGSGADFRIVAGSARFPIERELFNEFIGVTFVDTHSSAGRFRSPKRDALQRLWVDSEPSTLAG
jgi:hypothetical protein